MLSSAVSWLCAASLLAGLATPNPVSVSQQLAFQAEPTTTTTTTLIEAYESSSLNHAQPLSPKNPLATTNALYGDLALPFSVPSLAHLLKGLANSLSLFGVPLKHHHHLQEPIDCTKYTIGEVLNWTLHHTPKPSHHGKDAPPRLPPPALLRRRVRRAAVGAYSEPLFNYILSLVSSSYHYSPPRKTLTLAQTPAAMALTTRGGGGADQAQPPPAPDASLGFLTKRDTEVKLPRATRVKNKTPAGVQITAEQILREARERQEPEIRPPKQKITDIHELADYRLRERKRFEDLIRRVRWSVSAWVKYARWEEGQKDFARARSVYERALDVAHRDHTLWLKYAEFEMRNRYVNHARNVWDRAVSLLPRIDQLWYKYIHMEEVLGAVANARQVFERWMSWRPDIAGWNSYIKFELRYGEVERARGIYERFVAEHPRPDTFIRYAKFEMKRGEVERARHVYERAADLLVDDEDAEVLFVAFAEFEEKTREVERARAIYKYALDRVPKARAEDLYRKFLAFEKQFGDREGIEDAIVGKRRFQYEDEVRKNPLNYDSWFDYIRLEESVGNKDRIRDVYERAIANVPPADEKRYWQRYIYLWINYALYEELDAQDTDRTREVYRECLKLIPHKKFTFAKLWLMAAQFEIRQKNIKAARQILGNAIGMAPKGKIFKKYIEIELYLGNFDRCRTLYEKYIEWSPANCYAWRKYAELEKNLSETDRARSIYELAIAQPALDTPEVLWKEYLQFEIDEDEFDRARELYERLLDRTKHLKVWISYAEFEASAALGEESEREENKNDAGYQEQQIERVRRCRAVFERAFDYFRTNAAELKEERAMLLEEWLKKELSFGDLGDVTLVQKKAPRKVKRKRPLPSDDGSNIAYEEYIDYIFPDEVALAPNLKILEAAYKWKKQKTDDTDDD